MLIRFRIFAFSSFPNPSKKKNVININMLIQEYIIIEIIFSVSKSKIRQINEQVIMIGIIIDIIQDLMYLIASRLQTFTP